MRLLIWLQVLAAVIKISKTEDEPHTTIILNDSQTEMSVEQIKNQSGDSSTHELFGNLREIANDGNDLDFDYDDDEDQLKVTTKNPDAKEQEMQEILLKAMRKPAIRKQIGEVVPILRVMSPAQRLTLAALVSSQIMSQNTLSEVNLAEMATMFASKNVENTNDRHNITEHLLLPISMDIAKMFKGLGKEMGRNLRQNFYRPVDSTPGESITRRVTRIPDFRREISVNRRMDEADYYESEERTLTKKPQAEALRQPGKDECDYFTKSLCLEVSNYPTEAIILSLKRNQEIAKTFLTDFDVQPVDERKHGPRHQSNGRKLERRQDGQNDIQDFAPDGGYMCPSSVKYARPKRARTTSGQWKYVVNAGDYTQTLRLEICQKPKSPCSYVTNHLNSQCTQIFNYHRLLTWDEAKGLHMDIFKVPSCCSCHIHGYSNFYPPGNDFPTAEKRKEPLEGSSSIPEFQNRPPYGYLGNKREVPKNILNESPPLVIVRNQSQIISTQEFYRNPVDHLVPPGPPLPLENEGIFNPYSEAAYSRKKNPPEQNRRYPPQAEYKRTTAKLAEGVDSFKEMTSLPSTPRLKASVSSLPKRPTMKFTKPHHQEIVSGNPQEPTPVFDSGNQIHFLNPSPVTPLPFSSYEVVRDKPGGGTVFITPNPPKDLVYSSSPKIITKQTPQFFKPEYVDNKSLGSRVSPSYVTPPRVKETESRTSTSSPPPKKSELLTSSGQKKINYNYHPIIDFFLTDSKKRQATYQSPQYLPLASQDWTPVVGH